MILRETGVVRRGYVDGWGFACGCGDRAQCGVVVCGVTYGFAPHTLSPDPPDVVVDSARELERIVFAVSPSGGLHSFHGASHGLSLRCSLSTCLPMALLG